MRTHEFLAHSESIQNLGIDKSTPAGQIALIKLAKLAAKESLRTSSTTYSKFRHQTLPHPEGQKALIEIAKLPAEEVLKGCFDAYSKLWHRCIKARGQKGLIEIATIALMKEADEVSLLYCKFWHRRFHQ